jgi:glutamine amidotransferase
VIAIVDYGIGNICAILNIYRRLNIAAYVASSREDIERANKIVLPGVGAFDWAMTRLDTSGLRGVLDAVVLERKTPVLGICIGMQMMACSSEEGRLEGLGWIGGTVKRMRFSAVHRQASLPHMGWNDVKPRAGEGLFAGLEQDARFYFLHSYYFCCDDEACVLATTDYHGAFACGVRAGNVFGVQFHPEKSHQFGVRLLENFALM